MSFLCSSVAGKIADSPILNVSMNRGVSEGDLLFATLRLKTGEQLLFVVDTGAPGTLLDKSLEPLLGKKTGKKKIQSAYGTTVGNTFKPPELYLDGLQLTMGPDVATVDMARTLPYPGRPVSGILGMDCLKHYCIQLDFASHAIHFLDSDSVDEKTCGKSFPITIYSVARVDFNGVKNAPFLIDTGDVSDGALVPPFFPQPRAQRGSGTNHGFGSSLVENITFGGLLYSNVTFTEESGKPPCPWNRIGLSFLERNLVTFDFPGNEIFFKQRSLDSIANIKSTKSTLGPTQGWPDAKWSDSNSLADSIMFPPNLRPNGMLPPAVIWVNTRPEFLPLRIPVGPPPAELTSLQLPAGLYHMKIDSKVVSGANDEEVLVPECFPEKDDGRKVPKQRGTIFVLHDYNSQKESMFGWAYLLAQAGYRVILVDLRGHGESTGQNVSYGKYETSDLKEVLDFLVQRGASHGRVGVLGVGYGANLALQWAASDSRIGAVVAIAPYNRLPQIFERMVENKEAHISPQMLDNALGLAASRLDIKWDDWSGESAVQRLKEPVLLIGGGKDTICTTNDLDALERSAPAGSKNLLIQEANHHEIGFWFHDLAEPVEMWFQEHMSAENKSFK